MAIIVSTLRILPPPASRAEVVRALAAQLGPTRVQPGCLRCDLYQAIEDPDAIILVEEWESGTDLSARLRSDEYRSVLATMELSRKQPEIQFDTVIRRGGLDVITLARA